MQAISVPARCQSPVRASILALIAAGVLAVQWLSVAPEPRAPWDNEAALAIIVGSAALLVPLGARPAPYALGLLALLAALTGMWLPGGAWGMEIADRFGPGGYPAGLILVLTLGLPPIAWLLLAGSVVGWFWAVMSYLGAGMVFAFLLLVSELGSILLAVLWPGFALGFVGLFRGGSAPFG